MKKPSGSGERHSHGGEVQQGGRVDDIRHIGVVVSDMEASLDFYTRFFGLKLGNNSEESGSELERILGIPNVRLRSQKLLTDIGDTRLELVEFFEPRPSQGSPRGATNVGITHFAITVHGIDRIHQEMNGAGIFFVSPPQMEKTGFAKIAFCRDPDGNLIELIEVQPKDGTNGP